MKKTFLILGLLACMSAVVQAAPCVGGTLDTYIGSSCTFGGLTFSDFSYISSASGGAAAPSDSGVAVNPEVDGSEVGLLFSAGWLAGQNQIQDSLIQFTVTCIDCMIDDVVLIMGGGANGSGLASVSETSLHPVVNLITGGSKLIDSTTFSPVNSIKVVKDIAVSGGSAENGFAHISAVTNLFSTTTTTMTPEPSLSLLCLGFLGLVPLARRKMRRV